MSTIFVKQPNGLYCRYSTITDCVTDYNFTEEDVRKHLTKKYEKEIDKTIEELKLGRNEWGWDFQDVVELCEEYGMPNGNMSREEFNEFIEEANTPFENKEEKI